jgi:two-component system, chemotaxis family, chemotaxis protein CheY
MVDKTIKILFVEDSEVQQELGIYRLENLGFRNVTGVSNGVEAIAYVEKNPVDLIISDWDMPEMDGLEFLKSIRSKPDLQNIPFVMMTADGKPAKDFAAKKEGVTEFLLKPVSNETLSGIIKKIFN